MKIKTIIGYGLSSPYSNSSYLGYLENSKLKNIGIVEVHTDTGIIGFGETYSGVYCAELIEPVVNFLNQFLVGMDLEKPKDIHDKIYSIPYVGRNGLLSSISSAINIAIYDALGKNLGLPVYALLSSTPKDKVKVYASNGSCTFSPDDIRSDVKAIMDLGYDSYKMRIGYHTWETDLVRVSTAREYLGNSNNLMVDAIMGTLTPPWDRTQAYQKIYDLYKYNIYWVEEPVHPTDIEALEFLRNVSEIPIAAGEALNGQFEFKQYLENDCVDIIQPDVTHSGGFDECKAIVDMFSTNYDTAMHVWGSGLAVLANAHFALSSNIKFLEMPMMNLDITNEILESQFTIDDGYFYAPDVVGIGVNITDEIKEKYKLKTNSNYRI